MREDTGMRPARQETGPLVPGSRWRRVVRAVRAILRPRADALSWGAGRLAAGAILAAGVVAQALFGWRWWVVVIVLTVAGEAAIVASTLARSAERDDLVDELLGALAPRRQRARRSRRALARLGAAPFPLYGLPPAWTGPRFLGGWSARRDLRAGAERTTSVRLGHGDPSADRGPLLLVEVDADIWARPTRPDLAARLAHSRPVGPEVGSEARPVGPEVGSEARPAGPEVGGAAGPAGAGRSAAGRPGPEVGGEVERVEIPVDGEAVGFEVLADGRRWVAQGELGDLVVTLDARDLPPGEVRLVRIADLVPYLADPAAP
jgi:hypothetical protein